MKRIFAIFFSIAFVFQNTSSFWIMASFYAQREYIAENLCKNRFEAIPVCKGQCYLATQLEKNQQTEQSLPDLKQKEVQLFFQQSYFFYFSDYTKKIFTDRERKLSFFEIFFLSEFLCSIFHPPQSVISYHSKLFDGF